MDKNEFVILVNTLKTYYPRESVLSTPEAIELWFRQLKDLEYRVAMAGLIKWTLTNKWSPTIADLREMAVDVIEGEPMDYGEAWGEVQRAITRFGSFRPEEALNSMAPLTRKTVEQMGFINLCMSENPVSDRAQFKEIYTSLVKRQRKDAQLTPELRLAMSKLQGIGTKEDSYGLLG